MSQLSPNATCPCGSGLKYKKCCQRYHRGAIAPDALSLMKSRYSAYAASEANYIIRTTHPDNPDYTDDAERWREEILNFCRSVSFNKLEIVSFEDGEQEAFVHFQAYISDDTLDEKSRFLHEDGRWFYVDGVIMQHLKLMYI